MSRPPMLLATALTALLLGACGASSDATAEVDGLSPTTMAAAPPASPMAVDADVLPDGAGGPAPVQPYSGVAPPPARAGGVVLRILAEGEVSLDGQLSLPAMERDMVYLMARVETEAGAPVAGAEIEIVSRNGTLVLLDDTHSDEYGYAAFTLYAARAGTDTLTLSAAGVSTDFSLEVIALDASPWLEGLQGEGITRWSALRDVELSFEEAAVSARFGDSVRALEGKRVRLAGYMMPLSADMQQTHFLISASPPDCFFHVPGGPTTIAEVQTLPAGVAMTMEPLVVEGVLRLLSRSEQGIVFRVEEATARAVR